MRFWIWIRPLPFPLIYSTWPGISRWRIGWSKQLQAPSFPYGWLNLAHNYCGYMCAKYLHNINPYLSCECDSIASDPRANWVGWGKRLRFWIHVEVSQCDAGYWGVVSVVFCHQRWKRWELHGSVTGQYPGGQLQSWYGRACELRCRTWPWEGLRPPYQGKSPSQERRPANTPLLPAKDSWPKITEVMIQMTKAAPRSWRWKRSSRHWLSRSGEANLSMDCTVSW